MAKNTAVLGDPSTHGGTLISTNQDGRFKLTGIVICAHGCLHSCIIPGHGVASVSATTVKSKVNGKLIVTTGAVAGCGAVIVPPYRKSMVE